jgi:hypothetical protein
MLIEASAIPDPSAWNFTGPVLNSDGFNPNDEQVDPPECAPIFSGPAHAQKGVVLWSSIQTDGPDADKSGPDFSVSLAVPTGQPDLQGLRGLLGKCGTFQGDGLPVTMSPSLQLPGLPDSAVARRWTVQVPVAGGIAGAEIIGLTRGLYLKVSANRLNTGEISAGDTDILVTLFNEQVSRLEAA